MGCFHFLTVLNKVAINVIIHVFCYLYVLSSFGFIAKLHRLGSFVRLTFSFSNLYHIIPNDFPNGCTNLPAMYESTSCFTFSLVLGIVNIFKFSHPGWYAVVFLLFLLIPWLLMKLTPFHMLTGHLGILFYDMTIQVYWPLFLLSCFFLVIYWSFLFILDMSPLSVVCIICICVDVGIEISYPYPWFAFHSYWVFYE